MVSTPESIKIYAVLDKAVADLQPVLPEEMPAGSGNEIKILKILNHGNKIHGYLIGFFETAIERAVDGQISETDILVFLQYVYSKIKIPLIISNNISYDELWNIVEKNKNDPDFHTARSAGQQDYKVVQNGQQPVWLRQLLNPSPLQF